MVRELVAALGDRDHAGLRGLLPEVVTFHSPVTDYRGRDDVAHMLATIGSVVTDMRAMHTLVDSVYEVAVITGRVGDSEVDGVLTWCSDTSGQGQDITLLIRPHSALRTAIRQMGEALGRDPLPSQR